MDGARPRQVVREVHDEPVADLHPDRGARNRAVVGPGLHLQSGCDLDRCHPGLEVHLDDVGVGIAVGRLRHPDAGVPLRGLQGLRPAALLEQVAQALVNMGALLFRLRRFADAVAVSDDVLRRFGSSETLALQEQVAKALVNRGAAFGGLQRPDDVLAACDEVVGRYGTSRAPALMEAVVLALGNKALTLDGMGRTEDALAACYESARRLEESEVPALRPLTERALLDKADMEIRYRQFEAAVETAGRLLDWCGAQSLENRLRAHMLRSKAALARGDQSACERDIESVLDLLPALDFLPREVMDVLMSFSIEFGSRRMHALIDASPSAALLLPLMTVLEEDLGLEPRVAREVEAVAEDIRAELAKRRASPRRSPATERRNTGQP